MTIEVVLISASLIWGGVELVKHLTPTWYDKANKIERDALEYVHRRMDTFEKKIEELNGGAK